MRARVGAPILLMIIGAILCFLVPQVYKDYHNVVIGLGAIIGLGGLAWLILETTVNKPKGNQTNVSHYDGY